MNTNTVEILAENEITLENAKVEYDNGQTLFNGIYEATHRGVKVASVRETENGYTFLSNVNYKPVGSNYSTENLSVQELIMILDNIKYYYFKTNLNEQQLNIHQQSIINVLLRRARRGAPPSDLITRIEQLKDTWKSNSVMIEFLNGLNLKLFLN